MNAADERANFIEEKGSDPGSKQKRPTQAWRTTVFASAAAACLVLAANVGLLVWANQPGHERLVDGTVVFEGTLHDPLIGDFG
jgi:anti-sigma-K factor RskA